MLGEVTTLGLKVEHRFSTIRTARTVHGVRLDTSRRNFRWLIILSLGRIVRTRPKRYTFFTDNDLGHEYLRSLNSFDRELLPSFLYPDSDKKAIRLPSRRKEGINRLSGSGRPRPHLLSLKERFVASKTLHRIPLEASVCSRFQLKYARTGNLRNYLTCK